MYHLGYHDKSVYHRKIHPCVETAAILEASHKLSTGEKENRKRRVNSNFSRARQHDRMID